MFAITLNGTTNAGGTQAYSSPFMDYAADVAWVGDNEGRLHKFTGVFYGTPAEVTTGGFPATVSAAGIKLSPPVYDFAGNVFVGSSSGGAGVGGMLHRVNAATGAVTSSAKMAVMMAGAGRVPPPTRCAPAARPRTVAPTKVVRSSLKGECGTLLPSI